MSSTLYLLWRGQLDKCVLISIVCMTLESPKLQRRYNILIEIISKKCEKWKKERCNKIINKSNGSK
jgi:hypothetical protein